MLELSRSILALTRSISLKVIPRFVNRIATHDAPSVS